MPANPPFRPGASYDTSLSPLDEMAFRQWVQGNNIPFNVNASGPTDYDMRGYWQGMRNGNPMAGGTQVNPNDGMPHFTDYYKTPAHQTFSNESQWGSPNDPQWINDSQLASPNGRIVYDEKAQNDPDKMNSLARLLLGGQ